MKKKKQITVFNKKKIDKFQKNAFINIGDYLEYEQ